MIVNLNRVWPANKDGRVVISIGYIQDDEYYDYRRDRVESVAEQWLDVLPRNVRFSFRGDPNRCHVRISFAASPGNGDWFSQIGTAARNVHKSKPTTYLKWTSDKKVMNRHILHEFGHILGAEHEQFSSEFPWQFNSTAVYDHYEQEVKNENESRTPKWSDKRVKENAVERAYTNVFKRVDESNVRHSIFDDQSIMLYYMKKSWLKQSGSEPTRTLYENYSLSYCDGAIMYKVYDEPDTLWSSDSDTDEDN